MQIRTISNDEYQLMIDIHKSLNIAWPEQPGEVQTWQAEDRARDPRCKYQRWLAFEKGQAVGFARYGQGLEDCSFGRFNVFIEVHPKHQRRGIGTALYSTMMENLDQHNPRILRADAFTNLPEGFRFLEQRGFYEAFRETPVHLEIDRFDPNPYTHVSDGLTRQGIVISSLTELVTDPDRDRKVYDLYCELDGDLPRETEAPYQKPEFADWIRNLDDPSTITEAFFVAVKSGMYLGLRELGAYPGNHTLIGGLLGVRKEYRRSGIGLALQLRGIEYARENGYSVVKTCTAKQNTAMQALFNKLGYQRGPEWIQCQKNIGRPV